MSVCVTIRTKKVVPPNVYLKSLADKGEQIVVTSNEYPSVKFGNHQKAIRGIEVNKEDNGLEVRVCSFSSTADYQLFAKTVDVLMEITGDKAYLENNEEEEITAPFEIFNDEWIELQHKSSLNVTRALINRSGQHIVMYGLFCPFCLGPNLYSGFDIPLAGDYENENVERLMEYLCDMQWFCAGLEDTSTRMIISSPTGEAKDGLSMSMICIEDGEVGKFDYISEASLLGIMDMDNEEAAPVLIPFREVWKILPKGVFAPLDELQYVRKEELTVDMVREMMDRARHLQPDDLHYKPTYPGAGFDEVQHTFILMWNPDISSVSLEDHIVSIQNMYTQYFNWSVWEHEKAKCGDRFYLVRVGNGNTGIVMSGVFDSHPYEAGDWSGKGRRVFYMDMLPNVILNPDNSPMITTEELQKAIPSFDWTGGHSGRLLSQEDAQKLETIWAGFLKKNEDRIDGEIFNINRHVTFDNRKKLTERRAKSCVEQYCFPFSLQ